MALPPVHFFVGAAAAELSRGTAIPRGAAWGLGGVVAVLPDAGSVVVLVLADAATGHGRVSHTLAAVVAVGALAGAVAGRRWALLAGAAWASHLLVDLLRAGAETGVALLWPLTESRLAPVAAVYRPIPFEWTGAEGAFPDLHGPDPLGRLAVQTAVALAVFAAVAATSHVVRRRIPPQPSP